MPFYNGDGTVRDGDPVYGLADPRDAFWARYGRKTKLYVIEQFYIINGDSDA